jgi:lysophospholipase
MGAIFDFGPGQQRMFTQIDYFPTFDRRRIRWGALPATGARPRGTVVLLNGRTEYLEKYAETTAELARRGWGVYSLDWRGQGLSDRLTADRRKGHVGRFEDYLEDLERLLQMVPTGGTAHPMILLGHSMGAHIGLRLVRERRHPFACAVLTSPMIDIQLPPVPRRWLRAYVKAMVRLGFAANFAPGGAAYLRRDLVFDDNPLTSDPERFQRRLDDIAANPRLALGGVTYGWLNAAFDSIERVMAPGFARGLTLPLLIVRATADRIVSRRAQTQFCRRAPDCRLVDVPGARHELLVETDAHRRSFWEAFDRFTAALTEGPDNPQEGSSPPEGAAQSRPSSTSASK